MSTAHPAASVSEYRSPDSRLIAKQFLGRIEYVSLGDTAMVSFSSWPTMALSIAMSSSLNRSDCFVDLAMSSYFVTLRAHRGFGPCPITVWEVVSSVTLKCVIRVLAGVGYLHRRRYAYAASVIKAGCFWMITVTAKVF